MEQNIFERLSFRYRNKLVPSLVYAGLEKRRSLEDLGPVRDFEPGTFLNIHACFQYQHAPMCATPLCRWKFQA